MNFLLGFISCFILLAFAAYGQKLYNRYKSNKHSQNSRVTKAENVVAVLNSGHKNKKVINEGFVVRFLNTIKRRF